MGTLIVDIHDAGSRLSQLIDEVEQAGDVVVTRDGQPIAKIIPWPPARPERTPGAWAGRVSIHAGIVGPDDDAAALFEQA